MKNPVFLAIIVAVFSFVVYKLSSVLLPFIISFVIAYFLHPVAVKFSKNRFLSKKIVVCLIIAGFFLFLIALISIISPIIYSQSSQMLSELPQYLKSLREEVYPNFVRFFAIYGIDIDFSLQEILQGEKIVDILRGFVLGIFSSSASIINVFSLIFVMPILVFYLLNDWEKIVKKFNELLPKKSTIFIKRTLKEMDEALSGYVRGQILVCLIMAATYALLLSITGLNFGFLIGFLTGLFCFVPYVGAGIGSVAAMVMALFQYGLDWPNLLFVAAALFVGQIIESNFLTPKLIGDKVGLHPFWVIFGIFVFGAIFGFIGVIFAMPLTAISGVFIKNLVREYKKRS